MIKVNLNFNSPEETREFLAERFSVFPERYKHVLAVTEKLVESAQSLRSSGVDIDLEKAECAGLLHDIGYLPELKNTGFHPIDGAEFLRLNGFSDLAAIIICHSNSPEQSQLLSLGEIAISSDPIAELLTYWDVQVLQGGKLVTYEERLEDIYARYPEGHIVRQAHKLAEARIRALINSVEIMLNEPSGESAGDVL